MTILLTDGAFYFSKAEIFANSSLSWGFEISLIHFQVRNQRGRRAKSTHKIASTNTPFSSHLHSLQNLNMPFFFQMPHP